MHMPFFPPFDVIICIIYQNPLLSSRITPHLESNTPENCLIKTHHHILDPSWIAKMEIMDPDWQSRPHAIIYRWSDCCGIRSGGLQIHPLWIELIEPILVLALRKCYRMTWNFTRIQMQIDYGASQLVKTSRLENFAAHTVWHRSRIGKKWIFWDSNP